MGKAALWALWFVIMSALVLMLVILVFATNNPLSGLMVVPIGLILYRDRPKHGEVK